MTTSEAGELVPSNALEHALKAASTEPSARPLFYRLLLESPLFVLDVNGDNDEPIQEGARKLEAGTKLHAACLEVDGVVHTAVFTSLAALQRFIDAEHKYVAMQGRDLLKLMRRSHLLLNPGAPFGKQIIPEEIEATLSGAMTGALTTKTIEKETNILLGQPADYPHHLTDALSKLFRSFSNVRAAYLALCAWPETDEKRLMIGIDAASDYEALLKSVGPTLLGAAHPGEAVDFVNMNDSSVAPLLRKTKPFYRKKLFGIF